MILFEAIRTHLLQAAAVATALGNATAGHAVHVPARSPRPYFVVGQPGGDPAHMHLGGASRFASPLIQIDCVADSVAKARELADAIDATINGKRGMWGEVFVHACVRRDRRGPDQVDLANGSDAAAFLVQLDYMVGHDT